MPSLQQLRIVDVWKCLGGGDLQGRPPNLRGRAFWRDGHDFNVAIDGDKNCFYDHRDGSGGGVLKLVEVALNCDQAGALRWLITHLELDDNSNTVSPAERAAAQRLQLETERFERQLQPSYQTFLRELEARRDVLIHYLRAADDPDAELELQILYTRIDAMRDADDGNDFDDHAVRLTVAIVNMLAGAR